jgi:spermidine synthase
LKPHWRSYPIIIVLSLVMLSTEVTVTRLLAYKFFYHYVFLVLSLAQLGLAASGAWIYALNLRKFGARTFRGGVIAVAALTLAFVAAYAWASPMANLSLAKIDGRVGIPYLVLLSVLLVALYFSAGIVFSAYFLQYKERFHRLYAADLAGAAAGCAAALASMWLMGPVNTLLLSAALASVLALWIPRERGERLWRWGVVAGAIVLCSGLFAAKPGLIDAGRHAKIPSASVEWNHLARTDRTAASSYVIDGDAGTYLTTAGAGMASADLEFSVAVERPRVAIIGVGAGQQLHESLSRDASSVLGIDINPSIIAWDQGLDAEYNGGMFLRPEVTVKVGDGRNAIRASGDQFDLILMHAIDTYTASSMGAYSLSENHLYTVEAITDFHDKLSPEGMMAVRRWLFYPPRENLRLFTTVYTALEKAGVEDPAGHLMVFAPTADYEQPQLKVWGLLLFSKNPFTAGQLEAADREVEQRQWSYLYRPERVIDTPFDDFVRSEDKQAFYAEYPYVVRPCTDATPFFFQLARPFSFVSARTDTRVEFYDTSTVTLGVTLVLLVSLTLLLLAVPLAIRARKLIQSRPTVTRTVYFASLGIGFMTVEIAAIQIMTLFLGHPTYALVVVLLGILAFAGLGSMIVGRIPPQRMTAICLGIVGLTVVSSLALMPMIHALIAAPLVVRMAVTLVYLALISIVMGMPMAAGIRLIGEGDRTQVAWAWVCNGGAGVIGSNLCMFVMIYLGTPVAFLLGAACYLIAALMMWKMLRAERAA